MNTEYGTGGLKSPLDLRDITTSRLKKDGMIATAKVYPETYMTDISAIPVRNQGSKPSCVGYAGGTMKEYYDFKDTGTYTHYSRRGIYGMSKQQDGVPGVDGTYPRTMMKVLKETGAFNEATVPDDLTLSRSEYNNFPVTEAMREEAQPRVIKSYAKVDPLTWDSLRNAIYDHGVVAILISLDNQFFHYQGGDLPVPATRLSGHEMVAYGYDEDFVYFRNSHGEGWGNKGDGKFSIRYMNYVEEAMVMVDLPNDYVEKLTKQFALLQKIVALYQQLFTLKK